MAVSPYSAVTALIWAALGVLLGRAALRREPETAALIFLLAAVRLLAPLETVGSAFFLELLRTMSFPLKTTFIVSHKFGYVMAPFSLNFKKSLIYFFLD